MTFEAGAAKCLKLGRHYRESWSARCRICGAELSREEREEADAIRTAFRELRAEQEAADVMSDSEWDARRHEPEG